MIDLIACGVEDILITVTDNPGGLTQAITNIFPNAKTQICIVHKIRNSSRYVVWKDKNKYPYADLREMDSTYA